MTSDRRQRTESKLSLNFSISRYSQYRRGSSIGIATGYGLDGREVGVRVPVRSRICTSPHRRDRLWSPPIGCWGSVPPEVKLITEVKGTWLYIPSLPYIFMAPCLKRETRAQLLAEGPLSSRNCGLMRLWAGLRWTSGSRRCSDLPSHAYPNDAPSFAALSGIISFHYCNCPCRSPARSTLGNGRTARSSVQACLRISR
jgi:hypothetical protein